MTFAIHTFVGAKYGTWARGTERFRSVDHCKRRIAEVRAAEVAAGATHLDRTTKEIGR